MLPTLHLFDGRLTAQVVRIGAHRLFFSFHDDCQTCRSLIAFQADGEHPVVCDLSAKKGGTHNTTLHRRKLEPDATKWLAPAEFIRKWRELNNVSLPSIHHFGRWLTAVAVTVEALQLHFTFDRGFWPDLIAYRLRGKAVVCDLSQWRGGPVRTTQHRLALEADRTKWLPPTEFHRKWMDEASTYVSDGTLRGTDTISAAAVPTCDQAPCGC